MEPMEGPKEKAYIMLRRGQLMRGIVAKHPCALSTITRILDCYKEDRIMGVPTGEWPSAPPCCPPPTYGHLWEEIKVDFTSP